MKHGLLAGALVLGLAACGATDTDTKGPGADAVAGASLSAANARVALPSAGRDVTAAFLDVEAKGLDVVVTGIEADRADRAELHTMTSEDGIMRMRKIDTKEIAADATWSMKPMGDHVMLFGLDPDLAEGDEIILTLSFDQGGAPDEVSVSATLQPIE